MKKSRSFTCEDEAKRSIKELKKRFPGIVISCEIEKGEDTLCATHYDFSLSKEPSQEEFDLVLDEILDRFNEEGLIHSSRCKHPEEAMVIVHIC